MATKLQNLETIETYGRTVDATVKIDRESGTGQWTVAVEWTTPGLETRCWGRGKTLELALADGVAKAALSALP